MEFAKQIPIFEMPCGLCKAGSNQCCIFQNALAWFLQGRFQSMLHFSKCLGMVFARQVPINVAFFTMPWHGFCKTDSDR